MLTTRALLAWVAIGLGMGLLARRVAQGTGRGIFGDLLTGTTGAILGGLVFSALDVTVYHRIGKVAVAFLGAGLALLVVRAIRPTG